MAGCYRRLSEIPQVFFRLSEIAQSCACVREAVILGRVLIRHSIGWQVYFKWPGDWSIGSNGTKHECFRLVLEIGNPAIGSKMEYDWEQDLGHS